MGGKRKTDLSRQCRRTRRKRERQALKRKQMWLEHIAASMASFADIAKERVGTSFEMEDNWNAFSIAVARSNVLNALDLCRNQNNYVYIPEPRMETLIKQEAQESVPDIQDVVRVKLEIETEGDMDKQLEDDGHFVNVENINTFKVEPADTEN